MAKGVFTTKVVPSYDDLPEERYHFPKTYLNQVKETIGDWILYYEPRRMGGGLSGTGGRQSYIATAQVSNIEKDPKVKDHFYVFVSNYIEFDNPVPFKIGQNYFEQALMKGDGSTNKGSFGRSVRVLPEHEYSQILQIGFQRKEVVDTGLNLNRVNEDVEPFDQVRVDKLVKRTFRDAAFSSNIRKAYSYSCAMTGIKLTNLENRYEVEAAHIKPVGNSHNGPDSIRNGLALSRTFHWMFDQGIITISDQYDIIVDEKLIPDNLLDLVNKTGKLILPDDERFYPHEKFLKYHRDIMFRG